MRKTAFRSSKGFNVPGQKLVGVAYPQSLGDLQDASLESRSCAAIGFII